MKTGPDGFSSLRIQSSALILRNAFMGPWLFEGTGFARHFRLCFNGNDQ